MNSTTDLPTVLNARRLIGLRTIAIPGPAVCMLLVGEIYDLDIQPLPLILIIAVLAVINLGTFRRLKSSRPFSEAEFFIQMLIDVAALTGILYFTGGASNPFAFFFLLPLTITATVLPRTHTWLMAIITACCYTLLMVVRRPVVEFIGGRANRYLTCISSGCGVGRTSARLRRECVCASCLCLVLGQHDPLIFPPADSTAGHLALPAAFGLG